MGVISDFSWGSHNPRLSVCSFQIKYRQDFQKMKGAAHFHSLPAQDNLVLKRAQSVNKLVSEVSVGESHSPVCSPFLQWMQWPCWQTPLLAFPYSPGTYWVRGAGGSGVQTQWVTGQPVLCVRPCLKTNKMKPCILPASYQFPNQAYTEPKKLNLSLLAQNFLTKYSEVPIRANTTRCNF